MTEHVQTRLRIRASISKQSEVVRHNAADVIPDVIAVHFIVWEDESHVNI
ncbi:hypothetical protein BDC45DRAFT_572935 [Circinella umbellata]|nr:hypothetical protein BDC45DRAFT_572935 [Circinella umbellata]